MCGSKLMEREEKVGGGLGREGNEKGTAKHRDLKRKGNEFVPFRHRPAAANKS